MAVKLLGTKVNIGFSRKARDPEIVKDPAVKLKILRVLFIVLILLLLAVSIYYFTNPEAREVREQSSRIEEFFMNPSKYSDQQGYYSFVEQFLKDYLTIDNEERNFNEYTDLKMKFAVSPKLKQQEVIGVYPESLIRINSKQVVVRARVYLSSYFIADKEGEPDKKISDTVTFTVPVYGDGSYIVNEQPQIVATKIKPEVNWEKLSLRSITGEEAEDIMTDVESFLKAYFEGNDNDVSYFTDLKIEGLKGSVKYGNLEDSAVYKPDGKTALVRLNCIAFYNEVGMPMYFELKLVKKEKWKVEFIGSKCLDFENYRETNEEEQ